MLDVPGEQNARDGRDAGQQHQRQADAVRREVILDAQRRNPRDSGDGLESRRRRPARAPASAMAKPSDRRQQGDASRAARALPLRQQHQRRRAEERDVDGPGEHGQNVQFPAPSATTVLLITPSTSCG